MPIKVNTDSLVQTSQTIIACNNAMDAAFEAVDKSINSLSDTWNGNAAESAIAQYQMIKHNLSSGRHAVLADFATYLHHVASDGYVETETVNISLADEFL